jgi:hypothetical protein
MFVLQTDAPPRPVGVRTTMMIRAVFFAAALITALAAPATAWLTDTATHAPPTTGTFAVGVFTPDRAGFPGVGQSFVDPVFGSTIRRLTNERGRPSVSDIYGKNGFWNKDGTRMFHNDGNGKQILDTTTGAVVRAPVPGNFDGSFAPDDADVWYYFDGARLKKLSISTGATSVVKTFTGVLGYLGGSTDWVDRSGRYMLLRIGNSLRVWDKQADVLYDGALPVDVGTGWAGMSPDGAYVVTGGIVGVGDQKHSYAIDHEARRLSTAGVMFWSLCGSHADLLSATNGKTYFVGFECHSDAGIWAVDVSIPQTVADTDKQRADNRKLIGLDWIDDGHVAGGALGVFQDWAYVSVESRDDLLGAAVSDWRPYKQEIVMANVLTGEVRRLAHHRSRSTDVSYYYQPRVSVSWDGTRIAWVSNFGYSAEEYADVYAMAVNPPAAGTASLAFTNPAGGAILSGTRTVTLAVSGGSGTAYTYSLAVDGRSIYTGANNSVSWNTETVSNAAHTLTATAVDDAGRTVTATRSVTVANAAPPAGLTLVVSRPAARSTVTGTLKVAISVSGSTAATRTYMLFVDGTRVARKTSTATATTLGWITQTVADGTHRLRVKVIDSSGKMASLVREVTVSN